VRDVVRFPVTTGNFSTHVLTDRACADKPVRLFSAADSSIGSNKAPPGPEIDSLPNDFTALSYQNGQLVANAEHYLRAVAVRNRRAKKYAEDLARAVLALDVVQLAKDVLHGGVRRYSSATRLAEAILMATGYRRSTKRSGDSSSAVSTFDSIPP